MKTLRKILLGSLLLIGLQLAWTGCIVPEVERAGSSTVAIHGSWTTCGSMAAAVVGMAEMVAAALTCIRVVAIVVAAELILPAVAAAVVVAIVDNRRTFGLPIHLRPRRAGALRKERPPASSNRDEQSLTSASSVYVRFTYRTGHQPYE